MSAPREEPRQETELRAPGTGRLLDAGLVLVSVAAVLATACLALVHVDNRYAVDHVGGVRMALARSANEGLLYPPLAEDGYYGGTRFMPLPIVLHAGAARLTGEYLMSGKLVAYATMALLVSLSYVALRRLGCAPPLAGALATLVLLTRTGLGAALGLRADALPLLLQLGAVWLVATDRRPRRAAAAGALAALAFAAKLSAVWAPLAIGIWLLVRDRRALAWFAPSYAVAAAVLVGIFQLLSGGRMIENMTGLGGAGLSARGLLTAPYRLVLLGVQDATPAWFLVPAVAVAAWYAVRERRDEVWLLALACSTVVVAVVLADIGTGWNQLVDPAVLVAIAVGVFAARTLPSLAEGRLVAVGLALAVLWLGGSALVANTLPEVRQALDVVRNGPGAGLDPRPLDDLVTEETRLLSEDPYVPVVLGRRPVVLDPFMLLRLAATTPEVVAPLVERIRAQEFDVVVLLHQGSEEDRRTWFTDYHFGPEIAAALEDAYTYRQARGRYDIHVPRP